MGRATSGGLSLVKGGLFRAWCRMMGGKDNIVDILLQKESSVAAYKLINLPLLLLVEIFTLL